MALSFPSNPSVGQTFTSGTKTWAWSGEQWVAKNVTTVTPGGGGTITGGQNSGTGIGTFKDISGTNLRFKSIASTGTNITVSETNDTLSISAPNAVTSSQNVVGATGEGSIVPATPRSGSNLQFKKIRAGSNVTVTDGTNDVIISASGGGGGGGGTVTNVTGTSPISVTNGTTTPSVSLGVVPSNLGGAGAVNGILKANGAGTVSAAVAGTDYLTSANFTGAVLYFASPSAPAGWLECNGALIPSGGSTASLYSFLASAGWPFGGVGKIPDLRGKFIRSNGTDGTYTSGTFGATQADLIKNHTHSGATDVRGDHVHTFSQTASIPTNSVGGQPEKLLHENTTQGVVNNWSANMNPTGNHAHNFTTGNPDSSLGGSETRPANVALLACIKL